MLFIPSALTFERTPDQIVLTRIGPRYKLLPVSSIPDKLPNASAQLGFLATHICNRLISAASCFSTSRGLIPSPSAIFDHLGSTIRQVSQLTLSGIAVFTSLGWMSRLEFHQCLCGLLYMHSIAVLLPIFEASRTIIQTKTGPRYRWLCAP